MDSVMRIMLQTDSKMDIHRDIASAIKSEDTFCSENRSPNSMEIDTGNAQKIYFAVKLMLKIDACSNP